MAIVNCPACSRKVSNVTAMCPYCGFKRGAESEAQLQELQRRKMRDQVYHLNMVSYVAITLFLVGFGWYWWASSGFRQPMSGGPFALLGLSTIGYLLIRILLFRARRKLRQFSR